MAIMPQLITLCLNYCVSLYCCLVLWSLLLCYVILYCLYTATLHIERPVGTPVFLHCAWNCSHPSSWGSGWLFNGKGLDSDWFKVPEPSKVGETERPIDLSRGKKETDSGTYSCKLVDTSTEGPLTCIL